jgi:hypothetical protein
VLEQHAHLAARPFDDRLAVHRDEQHWIHVREPTHAARRAPARSRRAAGAQPRAEVSKKWFQLRDTYGIEIAPDEDDALILHVSSGRRCVTIPVMRWRYFRL